MRYISAAELVKGDIITHAQNARTGLMEEIPITIGKMIVRFVEPDQREGHPIVRVSFTNYIPMVMPPERRLIVLGDERK